MISISMKKSHWYLFLASLIDLLLHAQQPGAASAGGGAALHRLARSATFSRRSATALSWSLSFSSRMRRFSRWSLRFSIAISAPPAAFLTSLLLLLINLNLQIYRRSIKFQLSIATTAAAARVINLELPLPPESHGDMRLLLPLLPDEQHTRR